MPGLVDFLLALEQVAAGPAMSACGPGVDPVRHRQSVSAEEAALVMGVTPRQVRRLAEAGRLPAQKVGRDWLVGIELET